MKKILTTQRIATFITLSAVIGVYLFIRYTNILKLHLDYEIFKLCFQFLLIIVLGGAVTLVFTNYTKLREEKIRKKEKESERRFDCKKSQHKFHNDFVQSYNSIKLIRRMIRARARILFIDEQNNKTVLLDTKTYDNQLQELTKLQLQFEFYIDEAESNPSLFPDKGVNSRLQTEIKLMRDYLNELVTEYEDCYKLFKNRHYVTKVETIPLIELPILSEFIVTYKNAVDFKGKFRKPANEVQKILLKLLSEV